MQRSLEPSTTELDAMLERGYSESAGLLKQEHRRQRILKEEKNSTDHASDRPRKNRPRPRTEDHDECLSVTKRPRNEGCVDSFTF